MSFYFYDKIFNTKKNENSETLPYFICTHSVYHWWGKSCSSDIWNNETDFFISLFFWFQIQHSEYAQFHVYSIVSNIITHLKKKRKKDCNWKKKSVPDFYKWTMLQKRNKNLKILLLGCKKLNPRRRNRYMKGFQSF